jgi:hypothetical protein
VRERLRAYFGQRGTLVAGPLREGGFRAVIAFPRKSR